MPRRASVEQYLATVADQPNLQNEEYIACFNWLEGWLDKAEAEFVKAYSTRTSVSAALGLAMIYDDENNVARRNALVKELVAKHSDKAPKSVAICRLFLDSIFAADQTKKPLDIVRVDQIISSVPEEARANTEFFAGWFLKNHGDRQDARRYLQDCVNSRNINSWFWFLANDALKRMAEK